MRRLVLLLPALTVALSADASAQPVFTPTSGSASWNVGGNWTGGTFPTGNGALADLSAATGARTINLNQAITIGSLTLTGSQAGTTTIAAGTAGSLTFQGSGSSDAALILQDGTGPSGPDLVFTAPLSLQDILEVSGGNSPRAIRFDGNLSGPAGGGILLSSAVTTLTFAGNGSALAGVIQVDVGKVVVNGTVGSEVVIGADAGNRVGGTGTILGGTTIESTASLAPGDPTAAITTGQLTTQGLLLGDGGAANYRWKLRTLSTSGPGTNFDQVVVTGASRSLTMGDPNNRLVIDLSLLSAGDQPSLTNPFWQQPRQWTVIDVTGGATNPQNGTFGVIENGTYEAGTFTVLNPSTQGGDVVLRFTPVPEPGAVLAVAAVGLLGWRVRRRRA